MHIDRRGEEKNTKHCTCLHAYGPQQLEQRLGSVFRVILFALLEPIAFVHQRLDLAELERAYPITAFHHSFPDAASVHGGHQYHVTFLNGKQKKKTGQSFRWARRFRGSFVRWTSMRLCRKGSGCCWPRPAPMPILVLSASRRKKLAIPRSSATQLPSTLGRLNIYTNNKRRHVCPEVLGISKLLL